MADLNLIVNVITKGTDKLGSLGGLGKAAAIGLSAATAGGLAVGAALVDMAAEAEQTQAKLENTFESMGAGAFTTVKELDKQAEALARATTFDDDAIKEFQTTMLTFGNVTGDVFAESVEVGADMAAFFGTDMQAAAVQLGKALNDPVKGITALSRVGVSFTEEQKAMIESMVAAGDTAGAQAIIMGELEKQVGGTASALANTAGGQMSQAMEDLGEAGESIGTLLLPVLASVAQGFKGLADFIVANMPAIQAVIGNVVGFISGIFSTAGAKVNGLGQIFQGLVAWVRANLPTISSIARQVFGAIGNVISALAPVLIEIAKVLLPAIGTAATIAFKVLDVAFKGIGGAVEILGNVFEAVFGFIEDVVKGAVGFVKGAYNTFARFWNGIQISVPSIDIPFVGKVGGFTIGLPDLPMLASGGIVNDPTLAIIGEKGPEAVVPLDKMPVNQTTIEVTVLGDLKAEDEKSLADAIGRVWWANGFSDSVVTNG